MRMSRILAATYAHVGCGVVTARRREHEQAAADLAGHAVADAARAARWMTR